MGSNRTYSSLVKLEPWSPSLRWKTCLWAVMVPEFAVENLLSAEMQASFLRLQRWTCPWAEHSDDNDSLILYYTYMARCDRIRI